MAQEVTTYSDSDLGWLQGHSKVIRCGRDTVRQSRGNAYTRKQKIIARSTAEGELYATALGASESKGKESLLWDLGYVMKPVLATDAKANEHVLHSWSIETQRCGVLVDAR